MQINKIRFSGIDISPENEQVKVFVLDKKLRGASEQQEENISGRSLEFTFEDNTVWICDEHTMHRLFPEADLVQVQRGGDGAFELPDGVQANAADRGVFGKVAAKLLKIFVKPLVEQGIGKLAAKLEDKQLLEKNPPAGTQPKTTEGLKKLDKEFRLGNYNNLPPGRPYLLLLHGTNSNTTDAFWELKGTPMWEELCSRYEDSILAFQHRTLTMSPLQNAVQLAEKLPANAELHIISHSRGGIIGDIICRYARHENKVPGFSDEHMALLEKENRAGDIAAIRQLDIIFEKKSITVKRFIRVACPAAGTILASGRMDVIFNVLLNAVSLISDDTADILKELIKEVLQTKENNGVLPGIEAMSPGSVFVKVMNDRRPGMGLAGDALAVISGNSRANLSKQGLIAILTKLFFRQRNDMVVNTDSMYLGVQRNEKIQYFFDQGKTVSHSDYFRNFQTREAILSALKTAPGKDIPGFTRKNQYEIPATDRGIFGLEGGELLPYPGVPAGNRPIVIILPGIMGSNLASKNKKVWLNYWHTIAGGLADLGLSGNGNITAPSVIKTSYNKLAIQLSRKYDVLIYPFDWRKQLAESARDFDAKIQELLELKQPIKIIAHSMGGVLVRDFIVNHDETWQKLNNSADFRLLYLGSPLGGSHRILTVLFGSDGIINKLNLLDAVHTKKELLSIFVKFPGILSLLPLSTDGKNDFAKAATWQAMRAALGDPGWPLPADEDLLVFRSYRDNILEKTNSIDFSKMVYVAGKDKHTPCDYLNDEVGPGGDLVFFYTVEGDQSVTWDSGIPPQMTAAGTVYFSNTTHGKLANDPGLFDAIGEILNAGSTTLLSKQRPLARSEEKLFRLPEEHDFDLSERGFEDSVLGISEEPMDGKPNTLPVKVSVCHGDLSYASYPLIAGHFSNDAILNAEQSIDNIFNGLLSQRHALNLYPGEIGSSILVGMMGEDGGGGAGLTEGAIIVGLGEPETLNGFKLALTVEKAAIKYLVNANNNTDGPEELGISALIIGCGYGGLSIESSVKAILEGINDANTKVREVSENNKKFMAYVEFIELYEDKAINCLLALNKIEKEENTVYNITRVNRKVKKLFGACRRIAADNSEEWWRRFTVKRPEKDGVLVPVLNFSSSSGRAREEESELFSNTPLIDIFVQQISEKNNWTDCVAKTLFELMIPNAFKDQLKMKGNITWVLDKASAAYPWELLQDKQKDAEPLCIKAGMIRQLAIKDFRPQIKNIVGNSALVIADPLTEGYARQLTGAEREGAEVSKMLSGGYKTKTLIKRGAAEIVQGLFCEDYRIIHIAAHGFYNPAQPDKSGVLIGPGVFLTPFEIQQLHAVPELVFVNCCYLGKTDEKYEAQYGNTYKLAANVGTELIKNGVKVVIVSGWAVDDDAALDFATTFYSAMTKGDTFGEAVKKARIQVYQGQGSHNNTWGAYQCYGDPYYKLPEIASLPGAGRPYNVPEEISNDLYNLVSTVDTRKCNSSYITEVLERIKQRKLDSGYTEIDIKEAEGIIHYELGEYDAAVAAFQALVDDTLNDFTLTGAEKYLNAACKKIVEDVNKSLLSPASAIAKLKKMSASLYDFSSLKGSKSRHIIQGSAYRRIGFLTSHKTPAKKIESYQNAITSYTASFQLNNNSYALKHIAMMELVVGWYRSKNFPAKKSGEILEKVKTLQKKALPADEAMNYWDLITPAYLQFVKLLFDKTKWAKKPAWQSLETSFLAVWRKGGSPGKKKAEIEALEIFYDALMMVGQRSPDKDLDKLMIEINNLKETLAGYFKKA